MRPLTLTDPALLAGVRASYKATALAMSPLRLWMFDETSGTTAADSSGNGVNLTLTNGPALNAGGPIGRFCEFDGTDDYATGAATSLTGEWSAVALVRDRHASRSPDRWELDGGRGDSEVGSRNDRNREPPATPSLWRKVV